MIGDGRPERAERRGEQDISEFERKLGAFNISTMRIFLSTFHVFSISKVRERVSSSSLVLCLCGKQPHSERGEKCGRPEEAPEPTFSSDETIGTPSPMIFD
jgi:hypothetical protein